MTLSLLRMPMFGFFGLGFLFFCTIVAVGVWLAVKSGEQGSTKLGGVAGCAIAFALLVIAGMGALGCTAIALMNTPNEIVRRGPVKRFEMRWGDEHGHEHGDADEEGVPAPDPEHAITLRFELEGVEPSQITSWICDNTDHDVPYTITTVAGEDGTLLHVDVSLPITAEEVRRIREDFRRDFPNLRLPASVEVEIRREDDH